MSEPLVESVDDDGNPVSVLVTGRLVVGFDDEKGTPAAGETPAVQAGSEVGDTVPPEVEAPLDVAAQVQDVHLPEPDEEGTP